jgi:hypothetical protein
MMLETQPKELATCIKNSKQADVARTPPRCWYFALYDLITPLSQLQKAALVLNASRRFRYTLDLKKEEQKEEVRRKIRAQAHVIRVYLRINFPFLFSK